MENYTKKIYKKIFFNFLLSFRIAFIFNKGLKKENMTYFVFYSLVFGIALSVTFSILSLGVVNGFESELKNKILNIIPHIEVNFLNKNKINLENIKKKLIIFLE